MVDLLLSAGANARAQDVEVRSFAIHLSRWLQAAQKSKTACKKCDPVLELLLSAGASACAQDVEVHNIELGEGETGWGSKLDVQHMG